MINIIDVAILCALFGTFILFSFITGIKIGIKLRKDEPIKTSNFNPIKKIQERKIKKEEKEELDTKQRQIEIMLENIENYDGSGIGQKDIE